MEKPSFYAIIPANVRYADIPANAKLLYGEITALANTKGYCWASNDYFAQLYDVNPGTISLWVSRLIKLGVLTSELENGTARKLYVSGKAEGTLQEKLNPPSGKAEHSITESITEKTTSLRSDSSLEIQEVTDSEAPPKKHKDEYETAYEDFCDWAEKRRGFKFVSRLKQYAALKKARKLGIGPRRLKERWIELEGEDWRDGFDWASVVSSFDKRA